MHVAMRMVGLVLLLGCGQRTPWPGLPGAKPKCIVGGNTGGPSGLVVVGLEATLQVGRAAFCDTGATLDSLGTLTVLDDQDQLVPSSLEALGGSAQAVFTPTKTGTHRLTIVWSDGAGTVQGDVESAGERTTTFVGATYVDRMDNCREGPFRTSQGLALCQREFPAGRLVSVYKNDGTFHSSFAAGNLMVRGNSVWTTSTTTPHLVELRVDEAGDLRLIGSAVVGTGGLITATQFSGLMPQQNPDGLVFRTARFDGTALTVEEVPERFPDVARFRSVVTHEGGEWWEGPCRIRPGCASMPTACEAVRQCPFDLSFDQVQFVVDEEAAWMFGGTTMMPRPFNLSTEPFTPPFVFRIRDGFLPGIEVVQQAGQAPGVVIADGVLIPRREGARFRFELVRTNGRVLTMTKEFITTIPDASNPFMLRFDRP